jgi:N-acyl-D-amino-acid deacylase
MAYDLLIKNGTVVDGTGCPRYQADIAVIDRRIAEIGKPDGTSKRTIDASGLVVAPGFIDPHTHYDRRSPSEWKAWAPSLDSRGQLLVG